MKATEIENASLWETLNIESISFERSMDTLHRKQTGSYYTSLDLTYAMMKELVSSFDDIDRNKIYTKTFLEPCVGTGNFVFAYLRVCKELGFNTEENIVLLNNIYVCDINGMALKVYERNLRKVAQEWFEITLTDDYFRKHVGCGVLFDVDAGHIEYIPITERFDLEIVAAGFDIVVTNPPYKNLKAERAHYSSDEQKECDKQKYAAIGKLANDFFYYSTYGTLNLYKLFVEEIVERYLSGNGVCSLLIPSSILSDKSCTKLRTRILDTCSIKSLRLIAENSNYVDASQALCTMLFHKGASTTEILIDGSFNGDLTGGAYVKINDIIDDTAGNAIPVLLENEYRIRNMMKQHPLIKDIPYITNQRGELDITFNKNAIQNEQTSYRLFRGRHIGFYQTIELPMVEYVTDEFVNTTSKKQYIHQKRLVCQQIANMAKKRRIAFTLVPEESVLANSCNFIAVSENSDGVDILFLLGILNSTLIDWLFKLTSSNNHINNYEIDSFPIPIHYTRKKELANMVAEYIFTPTDELLSQIDAMVYEAYGISDHTTEKIDILAPDSNGSSVFNKLNSMIDAFYRDLCYIVSGTTYDECVAIINGNASINELYFQKKPDITKFEKKVLENMERKYRQLYKGCILNHTTFKLSDLDLEMIRPIPQGGSWKDIPKETVLKSKRLTRITQTGGRTTLYGRIDYTKPSYTITTYFNRPGNGTYVHPVHDRVLSVREAARFQCFPDNYLFCGNKADMLKQVGNAVPVLLAYNIAKTIREKTGCCTSVDLFSGAGGMTYGFKRAGINAVIANDFAESACVTLKTNCPEIPVLHGDITEESTKNAIIAAGIAGGADIICGGPPCQGFSLAGYRMKDDPRNQLFRHFIDIVSGVNPKVIVFENVEGLLSYQNGETYRDIIQLFSELGYRTEGRKLLANYYGVPQRRKRVIILCVRKDLGITPAEIYPSEITPNDDKQVTAYDTIFDLEKIECSENAKYSSDYSSPIIQFFKGEISIDHYLAQIADS